MSMSESGQGSTMETIDESELSHVLTQYFELFNYDCTHFQFYMTANSTVDWFGRTIRGSGRVHSYMRNEVGRQYEHVNFRKAEQCAPIERRDTHFKTRLQTSAAVGYTHPTNRVSGITSLKPYADSDVEDEEMGVAPLPHSPDNKTPDKTISAASTIEELTPPASAIKQDKPDDVEERMLTATVVSDSDDDEDGSVVVEPIAKRRKRTHQSDQRRLPQPAAVAAVAPLKAYAKTMRCVDDTSSDEETMSTAAAGIMSVDSEAESVAEYSELRYLEATGALRLQISRRQRSVHMRDSTASTDYDEPSAEICGWERPIRIRISYRMRNSDQQLQYALIIYEHLDVERAMQSSLVRRNLMQELCRHSEGSGGGDADVDAEAAIDVTMTDEAAQSTAVIAQVAESTAAPSAPPPQRTPPKLTPTPPATPTRKPRPPHTLSGVKRLNASPAASHSAHKSRAARSLRL